MIQGIDISFLQQHINWAEVAAADIKFTICRAGEARWKDHAFSNHFAQAIAAGLAAGAYYVFHADVDSLAQADIFYEVASATQLPPALDLEVKGNVQPGDYVLKFWQFCQRCEDLFGRRPMIYGSPYFLSQMLMQDDTFSRYSLWIAQYGVKAPHPPPPWTDWSIWQYVGNGGKVPGVPGDCDRDVFNGTLDDFQEWCAQSG